MSILSNIPSNCQIKAQLRRICLKKGIHCPRCNRRYDCIYNNQYYCKKCRYKFTLKRCLFTAYSKLSYKDIWIMLYCWLHEYSQQDTHHLTGLSYTTIRRWYMKFRSLIPNTNHILQGIVEVDEAFIGKRKYNNQQIVIGALERHTGNIQLRCIPNRSQEQTDVFILDTITKNSVVCTDSFASYEHLNEFFGYSHYVCNHSKFEFGVTNRIENVWSQLRQFIRKVYHHVWKEHLPLLLKEFQARVMNANAFITPSSFLTYCSI